MTLVADVLYLIGAVLYLPVLAYQMLVQGKNRRGWAQRLGRVPEFPVGRPRVWIHAVSVGEVNATPRLVAALRRRLPDHDVVISTTTDTGFARARALYGPGCVFRFPLDFSWAVARTLDRVKPCLIVLVELEVWYNLIRMAADRNIPVIVVNGRLTARSCRRLRLLGAIGRGMFARLTWVGAQDERIAERFRRVGVPPDRLEVTGSVKWDTAEVADRIEGASALARAMGIARDKPLWVCGSTGPGEEAMVLDAHKRIRRSNPGIALAVIPRKPERFGQVADLIRHAGFACVRRSEHPDAADPNAESQGADLPVGRSVGSGAGDLPVVYLGDTMGELRKFYSLATAVFVGRSLVPLGGSDPMEVAALAKPVIVGPCTDNFAMPVACLRAADAIRVVSSPVELADAVSRLCGDGSAARRLGEAARRVVLDNQGATDRTADAIVRIVQG
ncbi:MAG: 3-deoxy-D-manno-octulosonic acid transferase [Phycisphaerales bacterium]|nr:MAG: 3-deoxy-D-manno-octulosonic acid transferase [Phycisphaerales bacterium]